ncbi:MAG: ATP-binding cassette domain-containing protein, partial [Oscillospiraceae bacterium]
MLSGYTVLENVLLASELSKDSKEDNRKKAENLLSRLNISEKANEKVENLSGGQKQRACIARALMSNPQIILADEPTGALDRKNSTEIMELLKEISKERLVLVITHDKKICEFADNSVLIKDGNIVSDISYNSTLEQAKLQQKSSVKVSSFVYGVKNFKVNLKRYIAISIAISIGILAFMLSMSSANNMKQSITQFKEKNTAFNNGYIIGEDDGTIFKMLQSDKRIENIYYQYKIKDVNLRFDDKIENIAEKRPIAKSTEDMSYGIMPQNGKNQIAINTSLAKKFLGDISNLIGKQLVLTYDKIEYKVIISGIFNASYDDFIVSSDIEKSFYKNINNEKNYSISY